ncbi:hypothetical protein B0H19DRAFT_1066514 [Mycena capillaripes]|nr:hypothetical protein B0H19DRAFT_1066514 [Mycena capillaripes]
MAEGDGKPLHNLQLLGWSASINFTNGTGSFKGSLAAVIPSATSFNLTGDQTAMYTVVDASGAGALVTADANYSMVGCTWSTISHHGINFILGGLLHCSGSRRRWQCTPWSKRYSNPSRRSSPVVI